MLRILRVVVVLALLIFPAIGQAQQILIDRGVRAGELWCFPSATDPSHFYYIPLRAGLVYEDDRPAFSFLRYVVNKPSGENATEGITSAGGGGILTFRAKFETPEKDIRAAENTLSGLTGVPEPIIRGPIIFKEGRYILVSSIVTENGTERSLLASGNAPVFEGNQIAFSFDIDPERATLLLKSFEMATPDISVMFDMTFEGLSEAYAADVVVNWDEVQKHESFDVGVGFQYSQLVKTGAELKSSFDELTQNNAIQVVTRGSNENMEAILDRTLQKFIDIMFDKVEPSKPQQGGQQAGGGGNPLSGMVDMVGGIVDGLSDPKEYMKSAYPTISLSFGYKLKERQRSGTSRLSLNNRSTIERHGSIAFNIGDLYKKYKDNDRLFRTVNLDDPAFTQREVHVGLDGQILPEFEKFINSVTLTLRKRHQNGAETLREVLVSRETFDKPIDAFRLVYGWNEDSDRFKWLEYDYRTVWSFKGGGTYETGWQTANASMLDLYAPYKRTTIELIGDSEAFKEAGIRAASVQVGYDFFEGRKQEAPKTILTKDADEDHSIEITLPREAARYDYEISYMRKGLPPLIKKGQESISVLMLQPPASDDTSE